MSNRIDYAKASPEGYWAFGGVYVSVQRSVLSPKLTDPVHLWVSQNEATADEVSNKKQADLRCAIGLMNALNRLGITSVCPQLLGLAKP